MKRPVKWFLFLLFFKAGELFPQAPLWQWVTPLGTANNEVTWDVCLDKSSGEVWSCGSFDGSLSGVFGVLFGFGGGKDGFAVKYDASGNIQSAFRIGGNGDDEIKSIYTDPSGNIYITGYFEGAVDFDPSLFGTFVMTPNGSVNRDGFIAKYSSSGGFIWAVRFGNSGDDEGVRIFADANSVYVTGSYESAATFYSTNSATMVTAASQTLSNFVGAKYNQSGVVQWVVSAGGVGADAGSNVKADNSRVYFIGNYFADATVYNASGVASATIAAPANSKSNVMVLAFTQAGALSWTTNACSTDDDFGYGLTVDNDNVLICGSFKTNSLSLPYPSPAFSATNAGGHDMFLAAITKTTGVYNWLSSATGSGSGDEKATALEKTITGDIILTGSFRTSLSYSMFGGPTVVSSSGNEDVFVTGYNSSGNFLWVTTGGGGNVDIPYGISTNTNNAVYVGGEYATNAVFGTLSLLNVGGKNSFVGKTGCETVSNNSVASSQTICTGTAPVTFTGTVPTGGAGSFSYQWQRSTNSFTWAAAAGTNTNLNYSAPTATSLIFYRRMLISGVSCTYPSNTLTVTVHSLPDASTVGISQTVCATTATITANLPVTGTGAWSVVTGPGSITAPLSFTSAVTALGIGANRFAWTITNGVCPPSSSTLTITRDAFPSVSNAGTNQTVCAAGFTLGANLPATGSGIWTVVSGGSTLSSVSNPSATIINLGIGNNVYVWAIANGACPVSTSTVTISRDQLPAQSVAGQNQSVCATSATLTAINPSVGTGTWSLITGPSSISSPLNPTTNVANLGVGQNSFQWKVINGVCPPSTSTVTIKRDAQPSSSNAGPSQTVCASSVTVYANAPLIGVGNWSVTKGGSTVTAVGNPTAAVNGLTVGINMYEWQITNGVCPVSVSTIIVQRDAIPSVAYAGVSQSVCSSTATLMADDPLIGSGAWSVLSGQGTVLAQTSATTSVNNLSAGLNELQWTVANGVCPVSTASVSVFRYLTPSVANAGSQQVICSQTTSLSAVSPATGTGSWSVLAGPAVISVMTNPNSQVNNLQIGVNQFIWTVVNGVCPPTTATVAIVRDEMPDVAFAGVNQTVCGSSATITANEPVIGAGTWNTITGGTILSNSDFTTSVSGLSAGENKIVWKIVNGVCPESTDTTSIFSDAIPSRAVAGNDQQLCKVSSALQADKPVNGTGVWTVLQGGAVLSDPLTENSGVTNLAFGLNSFQWSVSNGICPPSHDTIIIRVDQNPTAAFAGVDKQLCGETQQLVATVPTIGTGLWTTLTSGANISTPSTPVTSVSSLSEGKNTFVWTVANGVCPTSTDTVDLLIDLLPSPAMAGNNQTVCSSQVILNAEEPSAGSGNWKIVHGNAEIKNPGHAKSTVVLNADSVGLRWTIANGVCPATTDEVTVYRDTILPVSNAGADLVTESMEVILSAIPDESYPGVWVVIEGNSQIADPKDPRTKVRNLSEGNNRFQWQVTKGNCPAQLDEVVVHLKEFNIPNAISPNDDGYNDLFHINGLENYRNVRLQIYNRWGSLLFETTDYRNDWNGTNFQGEHLLDDTYYYVLEVTGKGNFTGFIVLKRNK